MSGHRDNIWCMLATAICITQKWSLTLTNCTSLYTPCSQWFEFCHCGSCHPDMQWCPSIKMSQHLHSNFSNYQIFNFRMYQSSTLQTLLINRHLIKPSLSEWSNTEGVQSIHSMSQSGYSLELLQWHPYYEGWLYLQDDPTQLQVLRIVGYNVSFTFKVLQIQLSSHISIEKFMLVV